MASSLSIKSAVNFTDSFVKTVCDKEYLNQKHILGAQIPNITPFREFNFILLYILLQTWKNDAKKLRSPYFDFENEELRNALETFMNEASRHVSIKIRDFQPLAKKSYQLTLMYFNDVLGFLNEVFSDKITFTELSELNKFLKSDAILALLNFMESENEKELLLSEIDTESLTLPDDEGFLTSLSDFLDIEDQESNPVSEPSKLTEEEEIDSESINESHTLRKRVLALTTLSITNKMNLNRY